MNKGDTIVALSDVRYNEAKTPSTLIEYNLKDGSITKSPWETYRLQVGGANYSSDEKHIYALASVDKPRGFYKYNLETKEFEEIFVPETGFINNIQVVK